MVQTQSRRQAAAPTPNWLLSITRVAALVLVAGIAAAAILLVEEIGSPSAPQPLVPSGGGGPTLAPVGVVAATAQRAGRVTEIVLLAVAILVAILVLLNMRWLSRKMFLTAQYLRPKAVKLLGATDATRLYETNPARVNQIVSESFQAGADDQSGADKKAKEELKHMVHVEKAIDTFTDNLIFSGAATTRGLRDTAKGVYEEHLAGLGSQSNDVTAVLKSLAGLKFTRMGGGTIKVEGVHGGVEIALPGPKLVQAITRMRNDDV